MPLPSGISAVADPNDRNTFDLSYKGVSIGAIQARRAGWLAMGPEDDNGTAPYLGMWHDAFSAAIAVKTAAVR
jgi:hypothetical protein